MKSKYFAIALMLALLFLSGCTPAVEETPQELKEVNVGLSWVHEAQFAGMYAADKQGYYKEAGLKVIFHPYNYTNLAQELADGKYDIAILQADTILLAREKEIPVKAIFADYQIIPTVYYSKKSSNIIKPNDLAGKTVGVAYSERYPLVSMLKKLGISPESANIIEREYSYDKLKSGEYDAEAGWVTDGLLVKETIGEYNAISPYDYGVNWYADVLAASDGTIRSRPKLLQAFISATIKGWNYALENAEEAALLANEYGAGYSPEHLKFVLQASIPHIHTGEAPIGWMEYAEWNKTQEILLKENVMQIPVDLNEIYTTEFIRND